MRHSSVNRFSQHVAGSVHKLAEVEGDAAGVLRVEGVERPCRALRQAHGQAWRASHMMCRRVAQRRVRQCKVAGHGVASEMPRANDDSSKTALTCRKVHIAMNSARHSVLVLQQQQQWRWLIIGLRGLPAAGAAKAAAAAKHRQRSEPHTFPPGPSEE